MKIWSKRRFIKTIIYRVFITTVTQFTTWMLVHDIMVNAVVLFTDTIVATLGYYIFETIWKKVVEKWMKR